MVFIYSPANEPWNPKSGCESRFSHGWFLGFVRRAWFAPFDSLQIPGFYWATPNSLTTFFVCVSQNRPTHGVLIPLLGSPGSWVSPVSSPQSSRGPRSPGGSAMLGASLRGAVCPEAPFFFWFALMVEVARGIRFQEKPVQLIHVFPFLFGNPQNPKTGSVRPRQGHGWAPGKFATNSVWAIWQRIFGL